MNGRSERIADAITWRTTLVKSRLDQSPYLSCATYLAEDHHRNLRLFRHPPHCYNANTIPTPLSVSAPTASPQSPSSQHQITQTMDANTTQQSRTLDVTEDSLMKLLVQDLLVQQRDFKEARDIIQGSAKLQKKMFLAPCITTPEHWTLIQKTRKWFFKPIDPNKYTGDEQLATPVTLNPLLKVLTTRPNRTDCRRRNYWGEKSGWHNERACMLAQSQSIEPNSGLLASYITDPPLREALVHVEFRIDWPTPTTTRPEAHPDSVFARDVKVQSQTGLTLGNLVESALETPGYFRFKDQYGFIGVQKVPSLRDHLKSLGDPRILLVLPWEFELVSVAGPEHVVVPTAEEWA